MEKIGSLKAPEGRVRKRLRVSQSVVEPEGDALLQAPRVPSPRGILPFRYRRQGPPHRAGVPSTPGCVMMTLWRASNSVLVLIVGPRLS